MTGRRFVLLRHRDPSGVSGTGQVAEGVAWGDGLEIVLRWRGPLHTTTIWPHTIDALLSVHGHGGATVVRWLDPEPPTATSPATPQAPSPLPLPTPPPGPPGPDPSDWYDRFDWGAHDDPHPPEGWRVP